MQSSPLKHEHSIVSSEEGKVDLDFSLFIEHFSEDSAFQLNRTKFPLKITRYDLVDDKETIIYKSRSKFNILDFRIKKSNSRYDKWTQEIVMDKTKNKATIEINGIENGIMVEYYFEKIAGKWLLVGIRDSST